MFLVTVVNAATERTEQYYANRVTYGENALGFPMVGTKQVHLYTGVFGRSDSAIVIQTSEPVRVLSERYMDLASLEKHLDA